MKHHASTQFENNQYQKQKFYSHQQLNNEILHTSTSLIKGTCVKPNTAYWRSFLICLLKLAMCDNVLMDDLSLPQIVYHFSDCGWRISPANYQQLYNQNTLGDLFH